MSFTNPAGLLLLSLAVPILALHVLRPRRPSRTVSSTWLWEQVARPVSSAVPWQRLRPSILLVLQLLAVALLAVAVAQPVRTTDARLALHTVFVVDVSGSMAATDGSPDRLAEARRQALALRRQLPAGGVASVVAASPEPRVVLSASPDAGAFRDVVAGLLATASTVDFAAAFTLAASLETPGIPLGVVLLSDGGLTDAEQRVLPAGSRYLRIGERSTNRAITRLVAEPQGSALRALVTLRNTGGAASTQSLRLDVDGRTAAIQEVVLPAGSVVERQIELPPGDRVEAFLEGEDLLAADDHAFAVAGRRRAVRVLVMGPGNVFLERLLSALPGVVMERAAEPRVATGFDLAVYDRVAVPADPGAPYLGIAAPGGGPGLAVKGEVERPAVTLVHNDDALLAGLDLSDVAIAVTQQIEAPGDEVLVASERTPLLVRGSRAGRPFAYFSFALADSDLPLQVAFPVLADRLVSELTGASPAPTDLRVGQALPTGQTDVRVRTPGGGVEEVLAGAAPLVSTRPGFHVIETADRPERVLAVNADPAESALAPADGLPIPEPSDAAPGGRRSGQVPLLPWVVAAVVAVLLAEHLVGRRAIGVPRRQWRTGVVVRFGIVALLLAALAGAALPRSGGGVATLFLLDGSDSVGASGLAAATAWTREALASQPEGSRAGVAVFGGDAKLDLTVQERATLVQPGVKVDASRTDVAGALRLAAAVLPSDARRRVVLVSDGRATAGDAAAEAARLRKEGIQVDVHVVGRATGPDVAVARFEAPTRARVGERVPLRALVVATAAGPARLSLRRDGDVDEERVVELVAGENAIDLNQPAGAAGLVRFQLDVAGSGDVQPRNDRGFAAVDVEGPARVLVAEGAPEAGVLLAGGLRATGMQVDVVEAGSLPSLERLAGYSATVLVDVDVRTLSADQVASLGAATRDLGRGLVTIGGARSYALGGYRDSELEALLPVISEITDPKRKQSVAQVLAIDSSGSMGACHCAEGGENGMVTGGNRGGGGVNKTDISRAGAARAIEALSANDQVGVLAFNTEQRFVIPLQELPAEDVVTKGLRDIKPSGGTNIAPALARSAEALRSAKANLKHIILFTDGFTSTGGLAGLEDQARALAEEGITVSVLATGEGSSRELERIALAGRGRFYPGRDLNQIPQILQQEAMLASRSFVNEGEFLPRVSGSSPVTAELRSAPPLFGYVATTPKGTAQTLLRIGEDDDPLLSAWRLGLGRAASWMSDASTQWSQAWIDWSGFATFWSGVVKDTFPAVGTGGAAVRATAEGDRLRVVVDSEAVWPEGSSATARIAGPDLQSSEILLERVSGTSFAGEVEATRSGTYGVGASVDGPGGTLFAGTALVSQAYASEYQPGEPDSGALLTVSTQTGGRGRIEPEQAFQAGTLPPGRGRTPLAGWLLLAAAMLWPLDVALRRLRLVAAPPSTGSDAPRWAPRRLVARLASALRPPSIGAGSGGRSAAPPDRPPITPQEAGLEAPPEPPIEPPPERPAPEGTVERLLERKRRASPDGG